MTSEEFRKKWAKLQSPHWTAALKKRIEETKLVGLDLETTDLDPLRGRIRLVQIALAADDVTIIDMFQVGTDVDVASFLIWLCDSRDIIKVIHNAKFEAKWLMYHLGVEINSIFDTMLASQMIAAGDRRIKHGLDDVVLRYTGTAMDKTEQVSDWSAANLTPAQLDYARLDAAVLVPLYHILKQEMKEKRLERVGIIEFEAVVPIAFMELAGFPLNRQMWADLLVRKIATRDKLLDELTTSILPGVDWMTKVKRPKRPLKPKLKKRDEGYAEIMETYQAAMEVWNALPRDTAGIINLNSPVQVKKALGNLTKLDWYKLTTRDHVLALYADEYPIVAKLQAYRGAEKSVTSYGESWLNKLDDDGRIRADFWSIGAETGRMRCGGGVNLQQVPADKEHRSCFVAPEGRIFLIADYSQIELRIAANFSQDKLMMEAFNTGLDLHKQTASLVFDKPLDQVTKEDRDIAKRANFGTVYGIAARKFGSLIHKPYKEAEAILTKYFQTYHELDSWLRYLAGQAQKFRYTRTASDRLVTYTDEDGETAHEHWKLMGRLGRYGKNAPIQGTSADVTKLALRLVHDAIRGTSARIVCVVHDELDLEVDGGDVDIVRPLVVTAMEAAAKEFIERVPIVVDTVVSKMWVK